MCSTRGSHSAQILAKPWVATAVITLFGLVFLFLSSNFSSVNLIIKDSVNAIGFQVAFYYGLAVSLAPGITASRFSTLSQLVFFTLWPADSAAFLFFIAAYSIPTFDLTPTLLV